MLKSYDEQPFARFQDPIALKAQWTPLTHAKNHEQTHQLVKMSSDRLAILSDAEEKRFSKTGIPIRI